MYFKTIEKPFDFDCNAVVYGMILLSLGSCVGCFSLWIMFSFVKHFFPIQFKSR